MRKFLSILALMVAMLTGGAGIATAAELPPCAEEDSVNCYWDAAERGNGTGDSFTDLDGVAHYWDAEPVTETNEDGSTTAITGPASVDAAEAWDLWDATGAAELLPDAGAMVTYAGAYEGGTLTAGEIAVWDGTGNAYLFLIS